MKQKRTSWLRLVAIGLALMLAGDATGVFAAVVLVVEPDECCHASRSAPSCPVSTCVLAGCLPRAANIQDEVVSLSISTARERWLAVDEIGVVRTDEPPVPPPRG